MGVREALRRLPVARAAQFMAGSAVAQGLSAVSGLLFARWMGVGDYGLYVVVVTVMGAMTVLTKGGAHLGYTAILGRVWPDMARAAEAVAAVLTVRRLISLFIMPLVLGVAAALLLANGATYWQVGAILLLLVACWWADMRTRLVDQILFFSRQTTRVQMLDTGLALLRLLAVLALYWAGWLDLISAVALGALVAVLRVRPILMWIGRLLPAGPKPAPRPDDLAEIRAGVRRQMPVEFYYVFQAQIVLAALTVFGSVSDVAALGALTRINQLLVPVELFTYAFCVPIFAQARHGIGRLHLQLVALTMVPGAVLVVIAFFFPWILLWLVGPNYAGFETEIFIAAIVLMLSRGARTAWSLIAHRGWVRFSWVQIPVGLAGCAVLALVLDLGTVEGALLLQLSFTLGLVVAAALDFAWARKTMPAGGAER